MEVLLGTPPPPPPPTAPGLEATSSIKDGHLLSVRERMEVHRANPACTSCHRLIDPIGLALENFDVTGVWRIKDNGVPVDPSTVLFDGTRLNGPASLRRPARYSDAFIGTLTENLLTYALGRRVGALRYARCACGYARCGARGQSVFFVRAGYREKRAVSDEPSGGRDVSPGAGVTDMVITKSICRGAPSFAESAEPRVPHAGIDGAGLHRPEAHSGRQTLGCGWPASRWFTGPPVRRNSGWKKICGRRRKKARDFDLTATSLKPLEPYRDHLTIVSNTDCRMAEAFSDNEVGGDHNRSSAAYPHPSETKADAGFRHLCRRLDGPGVRAAVWPGHARAVHPARH